MNYRMDWIRFDKQLPPEDTTVMVSNGPALGHYHFKIEQYVDRMHVVSIIPLWTMDGKRVECEVHELTQWTLLLKSDIKNEKPLIVTKSWWERIKDWFI